MKYQTIIFAALFLLALAAFGDEEKTAPAAKVDANHNPRLIDPDPNAWKDLPMEVVISDFQKSDGIFSSFICDELTKRLTTDTLNSLKSLNTIDRNSRLRAFRNCLSPEVNGSSRIIKAISPFSREFPELTKEISGSAR